jgi:hypothetical protein
MKPVQLFLTILFSGRLENQVVLMRQHQAQMLSYPAKLGTLGLRVCASVHTRT